MTEANGSVRIEVVKANVAWGDSVRGFYDGRQIHAATIDRQNERKRYDWLEKFRAGIGADYYFNPDEENSIDQAIQNSEVIEAPTSRIDGLLPTSIADLVREHPTLHEPIIDGLLRRGETGNIVAASKVGKSWLTYNIALSLATGSPIFGCETKLGRVLIIDNELHKPTLAKRIPDVATAMSLRQDAYASRLDVLPLRGKQIDLHDIAACVESYEAGEYDLIIADAFYRFIPAGVSENDNQQVKSLYDRLDACNEATGAAWLNVHHSSKGSQGDKRATDVGAGAGSQSRAADSHIILREHEEPGVFVLEAAVRSFPPMDPIALRWVFPLWELADGVDTEKLKGKLDRRQQNQLERDREGKADLLEAMGEGAATARVLRGKTGLSKDRCERLLDMLLSEGKADQKPVMVKGNQTWEYHLKRDVVDVDRPR